MPRPVELHCESVRDRIDPFLDGDLDRIGDAEVRHHLDDCATCREELRLARSLRQALRTGLPALTCPPEVTAEVLRLARAESRQELPRGTARSPAAAASAQRSRWWNRLLASLTVRPAASPVASWAAVAILLLVVAAVPFVVRSVLSQHPSSGPEQAVQAPAHAAPSTESPEYTPEQIARAEREARLVLTAVAQVSRGAGQAVQDQVFEQAVMRPARRAVASLEQLDANATPDVDRERRQP